MFCHCICIMKGNEHYQQDSRALHHTCVSTCWRASSLASDLVRFLKSNRLSDNVRPSSGGMLSFCCLDIDVLPLYMYNEGRSEHYQQDSRALHHTCVSTCWRASSLASDLVRFLKSNRLSDNVRPSSGGMLSFCCLDIDVLPLYMYNEGQ